jgi:membrane protein implicated in regulation of membrane protease activity
MALACKEFIFQGLQMDLSTVWWLVTGGLIAAELITGTFYLLMLSVGAAASALAAHADLSLTWQIVVGAIVGGLSVTLWHLKKARTQQPTESSRNQDVHLDLGEVVQVLVWDELGLAQVKHRGAQWTAQLAPGQVPGAGAFRITEMAGNRLIVEKI